MKHTYTVYIYICKYVTFALCIKAGHTFTCVVSWAATVAQYWLTYKTGESADVHHNRRTLVCRKDSC